MRLDKLNSIYKLAKHKEDQMAYQLSVCNINHEKSKQQISSLKSYIGDYSTQLNHGNEGGMTGYQAQQYSQFITHLHGLVHVQEGNLQHILTQKVQAGENYLNSNKYRKMVENLQIAQIKSDRQLISKTEQKETDDLMSSRSKIAQNRGDPRF